MHSGIIVFKLCNEGSKSEGLYPFLYTGEGNFIRLYKEGDNPFENQALKDFDGEAVKITGEVREDMSISVTHIEIVGNGETNKLEE